MVVCRAFRRLHLPLVALRLALPRLPMTVRGLFRRCRRMAVALAAPTSSLRFVVVCAGNARLLAIVCC